MVNVPVIYALLPSKQQHIYEHMFTAIKNALGQWAPSLVMADFEISSLNAIHNIFPTASISGIFD
jgi:hypothetical protein